MNRLIALRILGLPGHATDSEIRAAWRKKAKLFHPDSPYGNVSAFVEAKNAFEMLCPPPAQERPQRIRVPATSRRH